MSAKTRRPVGARSFDDIKKLATLPVSTVPLCLAGDLVEQITQLEQQLAEAKPPSSLGDASPRRLIAERIVELQDRMREATVEFHLTALPSRAWSQFWTSMPTRGENESAESWSERIFPFYVELVSRCCTDPAMDATQVGELADLLHAKAWSALVNGCLTLNMGEVDVPNSVAASELTRDSEQT